MGIKSTLIKPLAAKLSADVRKIRQHAIRDQRNILKSLLGKAKETRFGVDHHFTKIDTHASFKENVPIRNYEALRGYIDAMISGDKDVLWPGRPKYYGKTSGTTSGIKYIPITKESMPYHIKSATMSTMNFVHQTKLYRIFDGKVMFLSGSPVLEEKNGVPLGRLSGIVNHEVPNWLQSNQMPSYEINCIEDWEVKLDEVVEETLKHDMRLIGGIPPWVQMYYERLMDKTGKPTIKDIFPNYHLFVYGGVNYEPYRLQMQQLVGEGVHTLETYPASEGFIAFQDQISNDGLLLNTNAGLFFEFIPLSDYPNNEKRLGLEEVEMGVDYALILSSNAGLWGYDIGDCVRFVSLDPYRIIVSGRVKHFISAFGEHVIAKEVEEAMQLAIGEKDISVVEFTVAPQINPENNELPYHEWLVEFAKPPEDVNAFSNRLDKEMREQNIYYDDLRRGNILQRLKITELGRDSFRDYMKNIGKLGGQNKVPRLSNDRKIAIRILGNI